MAAGTGPLGAAAGAVVAGAAVVGGSVAGGAVAVVGAAVAGTVVAGGPATVGRSPRAEHAVNPTSTTTPTHLFLARQWGLDPHWRAKKAGDAAVVVARDLRS